MLTLQILIDGFAISSLYALGAIGFTLIFGVSGVLNLSHGAIMVVAAVVAWAVAGDLGTGPYGGALAGIVTSVVLSFLTYCVVVRPIQTSRAIPREETEIFVLTGTLLWGLMLQVVPGTQGSLRDPWDTVSPAGLRSSAKASAPGSESALWGKDSTSSCSPLPSPSSSPGRA